MSVTNRPQFSTFTAGKDADTYGWDTAFAITFTHANEAIAASWPKVSGKAKEIRQSGSDDVEYDMAATLGPWQLTEGGDGKNVRMAVPITAGTFTVGHKTYQLTGKNVEVIIEVGMEWVPDPDQFAFVISSKDTVDAVASTLDQNQIAGQLRTEFEKRGKPLSGAAAARVVKLGKEWLITDGKSNFYIFSQTGKSNDRFLNVYQFEQAWAHNLKVLAQAVSSSEPAVSIITIVNNPTPARSVAAALLPELLNVWFNTNIGELNHVFAALDLSPGVSSSDKFAWLKPTATSYAVTDQGELDASVFGVLTMTQNNPASSNHQVSPFAIPSGSDGHGANAGFLISGPRFMQNMLLAGARSIFNDAPESSFEITNDGLTVQNTRDMVWGKFMMDNQKKGTIRAAGFDRQLDEKTISAELVRALKAISVIVDSRRYSVEVTTRGSQWLLSRGDPGSEEFILSKNGDKLDVYLATAISIAKGHFKMSLVHTYVEIEFIDLSYPYSSDFDVHVNYTEQVQLTLQDQAGKKIFWFDQILKNMVVSVTKTQSAITREIVEGAVVAALSLIAVLGPIIEGLAASVEVGEVTAEGGEAIIDAKAFQAIEQQNPELMAENEVNAAVNAAEQTGGRLTSIKNAFNTPKWKFVGAIAGLAGAASGTDVAIKAIIEAAAKKQWEKVPGFDNFAQLAIAPYTWPNTDGFTLVSTGLAGSLRIGLKVKPAR